jgi:hypothetical protein
LDIRSFLDGLNSSLDTVEMRYYFGKSLPGLEVERGSFVMLWSRQSGRLVALSVVTAVATACTVQLVAPYNSDLQQKASSMQAEVAAWDLTMRSGAGTIADDPRHPDVGATINKWHGEADAMLTLAVSDDPGMADCSAAAKTVYGVIESSVPANLRAAAQPAAVGHADATGPSGCEAGLVASIGTGIDDVEKALKYCQVPWVPDAYFTALGQNRATAPSPPKASNSGVQEKLDNSCIAEFKIAPTAPANAAGTHHGRAVSALLTTLQAIVYVETRKKAAEASK